MDTVDIQGNTDRVCTCGPSCRFKQLSEQTCYWSPQASAEEQLQHNVDRCDCFDRLLTQSLQECRWERVIGLSRYCDVRQRSIVVQQAATRGQWSCVGQVVRMGVPPAVRGEVACQALGSGEVEVVREMVELGVGAEWRGALCRQAASLQQWDLVTRLAATGLGREIREVLKSALDHRQLGCAVALMTMPGVHRQDLEDCVTALISSQQCDAAFVLELVKACDDPDVLNTALKESLECGQWQLVSHLVTLNVGDGHKEMVCDKAAAEHQWEVVIQLLCDGVSPAEWIVSELFEAGMAPQLLSLVPAGKVHSGVRALLLQCAVRLGNGDFLLQILQRERVPDREVMDTIMSAVHLRQENVLLQLLRNHSRCRRVFKQFFPSEPRIDDELDEEIFWTFNCFNDGGEKDLALCVGMIARDDYLVANFFRSNMPQISLKKRTFKHALSTMYAFCYEGFKEVATELSARSHYDRRYIFWFVLGQGDFGLAARVCGPGISKKDLKLALPFILNEQSVNLVSNFIKSAKPLFGREYFVQMATQYALKRLSDHSAGSPDQDLFLVLYQKNRDGAFCRRVFRSAVNQFIRNDDVDLFLWFFRVYFHGADLEGNRQLKGDCQFACLKALKARKYICIRNVYLKVMTGPENSKAFMRVVLKFVFGRSDLDAAAFLHIFCCEAPMWPFFPVCDLVLVEKKLPEVFALVLDEWLILEQWQEHAATVNRWLACFSHCSLIGLLRALLRQFRTEEPSRPSVVEKAQWCLRQSYLHTVFVLAFALEDWRMLEGMLTQQRYRPPFDLTACVERFVYFGEFSIAVALLRQCSIDLNSPNIRCEERRKNLADKCLDGGLRTWAVVFMIPDWKRIRALVQTGEHPDALNVALIKAMDYGTLGLFEDLIDKCTDPKDVVIGALIARNWNCIEKLMDKCTDRYTLGRLFTGAVHDGRLEIVRSVIWRVNLNVIEGRGVYYLLQWTPVLSRVLEGMSWNNSSNILQVVCLFVKAGVSAVDRSASSLTEDCPLRKILCDYKLRCQVTVTDVTRLVIQSGAVSYRMLDKLRRDAGLNRRMLTQTDEGWRQSYTDIVEAAATPCRLQHLARLAVSAMIGCRPGRPARIDDFPLPQPIKDLLYFKDVIEQYEAK